MENKRLLYISVHSVLEYDEVKLFSELGYDVFSLGAYTDPKGHYQLPRPSLEGNLNYYRQLAKIASEYPRTELPDALIDPFDVIVIMHAPEVLFSNWKRFKEKGKKVIWRTIGQSLGHIETRVKDLREQGLKVVRYSPMERNLQNYAGVDATIRFYKDPAEFSNWTGHDKKIINFTQTLKGRRDFCRYDPIMAIARDFPFKVFGSGNEDLGDLNGGSLPFDLLKGQLRDSRVFLYGGTWPASYTLAFMEAWMTGIPVVVIGEKIANTVGNTTVETYELGYLIKNGVNGYISDNIDELRTNIKNLLEDDNLAKRIGDAGRKDAVEIFGKDTIKAQWEDFLRNL